MPGWDTNLEGARMNRLLIKTEQGQEAFKARSPQLAGKLRSAYLLLMGSDRCMRCCWPPKAWG